MLAGWPMCAYIPDMGIEVGTGTISRARLPYVRGGQVAGGVTLLRAPIGFGKTSLLRQWHGDATAAGARAGWVSLSREERSIEGFLSTLAKHTTLLRDMAAPVSASARLKEAFGRPASTNYMLFIDDWDEIAGSQSAALLAKILASVRCRIHCHIACRKGTGLPVEALLATDRLRLIGQDALKFSDSEQRRLLGATEWSSLSNRLLAAFDGWPLAFKLLKSLDHAADRSHQEPGVFARQSGLEMIVAAKLAMACSEAEGELLDILGLGGEIDLAMLQEISGHDHAAALFDGLTALIPTQAYLDAGIMRYRLSPLLRPLLERRFDSLRTVRRHAIVTAAYDRSVGLGRTIDALNFALLAGDARKAVGLIEAVGPMQLMMIHGVEPVQAILSRLPLTLLPDAFRSRLAIPVTYAKRGCLVEARDMVEAAVADLEASALPPARKRVALRDAMFARMQIAACSDSDWALDFERDARGELSKEPSFAAWSRVCSGIVHHQTGRLNAADADFAQSELACRQFGAAYQLMHLRLHRIHLDIARGRVRNAHRALREIRSDARAAYPNDLGFIAAIDIARMEASLLLSRASAQSEALATAVIKLRQGDGWYEPFASAVASMARCRLPQGLQSVLGALDVAEADFRANGITHVLSAVAAVRAFYLALYGRIDAAEAELARQQRKSAVVPAQTFWRERHLEGMTRAMIAVGHGDLVRARTLADSVIADCQHDGRRAALVEAYLNRAQILLASADRREEALDSLALGIELVADLQSPGLLYEWQEMLEREAVNIYGRLQSAAAEMLERLTREWRGSLPANLLSERELSVLKGVAAGLTNKQIGRLFELSVDTIKFHLKQCFRKLQVQTRAAAVEVARNAELI